MTGIIQIINDKNHTGKLLLDDGRESRIIQLPASFESGDRAFAKFRNDDPADTLINITVLGDKWHFGFVMIKHGKKFDKKVQQERDVPFGNILPTYPAVRELLFYHKNDLNQPFLDENRNFSVKFKIQKSYDGKVKAVDISKVAQEDKFKCYQPKFGKLEVIAEQPQTGIVNKIVREKESNNISGKVKFTATDKNGDPFGIIVRDDLPDLRENNLWFSPSMFSRFYSKEPNQDDDVSFSINKTSKGVQLQEFCNPAQKEILPKNKQYGILEIDGEEKRFSIQEFNKFYKQECIEGDLVYFVEENGQLIVKRDDSEVIEKVIMKNDTIVKPTENSNVEKGKITFCQHEGVFGFIKSKTNEKIFFLQKEFQTIYDKKPMVDDLVSFIQKTTNKGVQVDKFHSISTKKKDGLTCPKSSFTNFVEVESDALYYIYENNGRVEEVRKFNPKLKSEAISCYKDSNLSNKFRLDAIESLIEINYSDENITQQKLNNQKRDILSEMLECELTKDNHQKALDYEFRLQEMQYKPSRLAKFNLQKEVEIDFSDNQKVNELASNEKWGISLDIDDLKIEDILFSEKYLINLDSEVSKCKEIETTNNWLVDLSQPKEIKPVYGLEDEILIEIQKEL